MFEKDSACRELGVVAFGLGEPHAVPAILGHFSGSTKRLPHGARRNAPPQGFARRDVTQLRDHQIVRKYLTVRLTKLGAHGIPKLGSPHERVTF